MTSYYQEFQIQFSVLPKTAFFLGKESYPSAANTVGWFYVLPTSWGNEYAIRSMPNIIELALRSFIQQQIIDN